MALLAACYPLAVPGFPSLQSTPVPTRTLPPPPTPYPTLILVPTPTLAVAPLQDVVAIAAGGAHTCALTRSGAVRCWGWNWYGQLGDGTKTDRPMPVGVVGLGRDVVAIAAGEAHTCALTRSGAVWCWGSNGGGELGDGTTTDRPTPVRVVGLGSDVVAIAAGWAHTCALTAGGEVRCWGANVGQLGDGTTTDRPTPVGVMGLEKGVAAVAAGGLHTCALSTDGGVRCWGQNQYGQLGDGTTTDRLTPVDVVGLERGVAAVAAGWGHTCALSTDGGVRCWGQNQSGELGDDTTLQRNTPVEVVSLRRDGVAITAGWGHTCALTQGGRVMCWGANEFGQLGDGTFTGSAVPVGGVGLSGVVAIDAGDAHTCALTTDGGVRCWGSNTLGQLGDGTTTDRNMPVEVVEIEQGAGAP
ncbi:MAG: chromosome condensation regulator RCC1 [Thermoflexales bacterium]|nr:chromosome condensation regulator RCC1 [Thermoflexales bacterium]